MNQETVRPIRVVSSLANWRRWEVLAEILGVVLASGIELVPGLGDAYGPGAGNAGSMVASNLFYRLFAGAVIVIVIISVVIGFLYSHCLRSDETDFIWRAA